MEKRNSKKHKNTHKQLFTQRRTSNKEATLPHSCFMQAIIIMWKQHMRFKPRKRREDKQFPEKSQQRRVAVTYSVHVWEKLNKSHHNNYTRCKIFTWGAQKGILLMQTIIVL